MTKIEQIPGLELPNPSQTFAGVIVCSRRLIFKHDHQSMLRY